MSFGVILAAFFICGVVSVVSLILIWLTMTVFFLPLQPAGYNFYRVLVRYSLINLFLSFIYLPWLLFSSLFSAFLQALATARGNVLLILALCVGCSFAYPWLAYHDSVIGGYLLFRQATRPVFDLLLLPLLSLIRGLYSAVIQAVNFYVNLLAFYEWGAPVILFQCALNTDLTNIVTYAGQLLYTLFAEWGAWMQSDYLHNDWTILGTLDAIGLLVDSLVPPLDCFCRALHFVYVYVSTFVQLQSLHHAINCLWNTVINIWQLLFNTIFGNPRYPQFDNVTTKICCTVISAGVTFEDVVYLTAETFWGILTAQPQLPREIAQFFSCPYASILTHPICGGVRLFNQTLVAAINLPGIFASDGSGVKYFQFGATVMDELRVAVRAFGILFIILSSDAVAFVTQLLLALVDLIGFLVEWIVGNVFYFMFGGPLPATFGNPVLTATPCIPPYTILGVPTGNTSMPCSTPVTYFLGFIRFYFVDYWLKAMPLGQPVTLGNYTYASDLNRFFEDLFLTDQALANLIGLFNDPLGQVVQRLINSLFTLVAWLTNLISYLWCVLFFQCDGLPITFRYVNVDLFFNELYFLAAATGDLARQFSNCTITPDEQQRNFMCCLGTLIETTLDTFVLAAQQIVHFVQDILTLPTLTLRICILGLYTPANRTDYQQRCVRIPDLSVAIYELSSAIDHFACVVTSLIPSIGNFNCQFKPPPPPTSEYEPQEPPKQCARIQTCLSRLLWSIISLFIVTPLQIMNGFFVKTINGQFFVGFAQFLQFAVLQVVGGLATIIDCFALVLDCAICAFATHQTPNCDSPIYDVLHQISKLLIDVTKIFTDIILSFAKLVLTLLVGLFGQGGNPIQALVQFIVGFLTDIFGGLGTTVINFIVSLFDSIGLGFIGQFINILWKGFCPVLQLILNIIVIVLKAITFGLLPINQVNFCCSGDPNCKPSGGSSKRDRHEEALQNGTLFVDIDNWLEMLSAQHRFWPEGDSCNSSVTGYAAQNWTQLGEYQQGEVLYCFMRLVWPDRSDNQAFIGNSTCDAMMLEYDNAAWLNFSVLERRTIMECMNNRLYMEALRHATNLTWLPQDMFTNPFRKYYFTAELARGLVINWQFFSDQTKPSATVLSPVYQQYWANMGLDVSFYSQITNSDQLAAFRVTNHLSHYFVRNGATQYDATLYTVTGLWSFAGALATAIGNMTLSLADNITDPTIYLSVDYSLGQEVPSASASLLTLISNFFNTIVAFTNTWSNPENYRKRQLASEKIERGTQALYQAAVDQLRMMTVEYIQTGRHEEELQTNECPVDPDDDDDDLLSAVFWQQQPQQRGTSKTDSVLFRDETRDTAQRRTKECNVTERLQYLKYYEESRYGEHSMLYRFSQWWTNFELPSVHVIQNPRYGTNRSTYGRIGASSGHFFNYVENGTVISETLWQRLTRLSNAVRRGTPASNARWSVLSHLAENIKTRFYARFMSNDIAQQQSADTSSVTKTDALYKLKILNTDTSSPPPSSPPPPPTTSVDHDQQNRETLYFHRQYLRLIAPKIECNETTRLCHVTDPRLQAYLLSQQKLLQQQSVPSNTTTTTATTDGGGNRPPKNETAKRINEQKFQSSGFFADNVVMAQAVFHAELLDLRPCFTSLPFACAPPLVCNGSTTTLCEQCYFLDQLIGRVEAAIDQLLQYYLGGQFSHSMALTFNYFAYSFDPTVRVIVGGSPDLPVQGFPLAGPFLVNMQYMSDPTPNKLRLNDLVNGTNNFLSDNNLTFQQSALYNNIDYSTMNGQILALLLRVFYRPIELIYNLFVVLSNPDQALSSGESVFAYLIEWFITCDWFEGKDYSGANKRFAIGELLVAYLIFFVLASAVLLLLFRYNFLAFLIGNMIALMILLASFLSLYANWSALCWPGLPVILGDDLFYFIAYDLFPKCSWFWGFLVDAVYSNDNCYLPRFWPMFNCVYGPTHYADLSYNIIFMLQYYFPQVLQWIRDTRTPLYILYQIPYINQRLNDYASVNYADVQQHALYNGCNWIVTLIPNLIIALLWLTIAAIFVFPMIYVGYLLLSWAIQFLYQLFLVAWFIILDLLLAIGLSSAHMLGEPVVSDDDTPDTQQPRRRSRRDQAMSSLAFNVPMPFNNTHLTETDEEELHSLSSSTDSSSSSSSSDDDDSSDDSSGDDYVSRRAATTTSYRPVARLPVVKTIVEYDTTTRDVFTFSWLKNLVMRLRDNYFGDKKRK